MNSKNLGILVLIVFPILGIICASYFLLYVPQNNMIIENTTQIEHTTKNIQDLRIRQGNYLADLQKELQLDIEIAKIERRLPSGRNILNTLMDFYYLLSSDNLTASEINFKDIAKKDLYFYFNMSLSINGNNRDILKFLNQLENYKTEVSIDNITFKSKPNDIFQVNLELKIYLQKTGDVNDDSFNYDFSKRNYQEFQDLLNVFNPK